jgi:hypothetical protein
VTGWEPADAWVLASIGVFQRPCTLTEVVAAGDWMNHAVLTEPEVEGALTRLVGSGLVRVYEDWTLELTDEGASLFSAEVRSIQTQLDLIEDGLAGRDPEPARVRLPAGAFAAAVAAYVEHRES